MYREDEWNIKLNRRAWHKIVTTPDQKRIKSAVGDIKGRIYGGIDLSLIHI